jgi:hypothetical protein
MQGFLPFTDAIQVVLQGFPDYFNCAADHMCEWKEHGDSKQLAPWAEPGECEGRNRDKDIGNSLCWQSSVTRLKAIMDVVMEVS